jgi:hypothetical protein
VAPTIKPKLGVDPESLSCNERSAYGNGYADAVREGVIVRIKSALRNDMRHIELWGAELDLVLSELTGGQS